MRRQPDAIKPSNGTANARGARAPNSPVHQHATILENNGAHGAQNNGAQNNGSAVGIAKARPRPAAPAKTTKTRNKPKSETKTKKTKTKKQVAELNGQEDSQALVDRCREGEEAAWAEMHARCQAYVMKQIRYTLGERAQDQNLVEEIAARVWFGLVADDGYLLERFQPKKGNGLEKYLGAIARFEVLRHQRSEYRRKKREQETQAARSTQRDDSTLREMTMDINEFLPHLTPREKEFFHHILMGNNHHHLRISAPNAWQLKHRIQKKLVEYLEIG